MKIVCIFLTFLVMAFNVCAEDKIFLYEDYYIGMSSEDFLKTGSAQCDKFPEDKIICNRKNIPFASLTWTQFFEFKKKWLELRGIWTAFVPCYIQ